MAAKLRVLIDLNIILDTLQKREPFYAASARVPACAETGLVDGLVAAHTLTTLFSMMAATGAGAQYLITRDIADYKLGPLPVLQPAELLALV
jgi:hypothetical protein